MQKISVELTEGEIHTVVKWHIAQMKRIPKVLGDQMLKENAEFFPRGRQIKALREAAEERMQHHASRAKELLKLIDKKAP